MKINLIHDQYYYLKNVFKTSDEIYIGQYDFNNDSFYICGLQVPIPDQKVLGKVSKYRKDKYNV
jgi:hypothetical protein